MDDVKDKFKGFMNKISPSTSSTKFKGQGRVLGSSSSPNPNPNPNPRSNQGSNSHAKPNPNPPRTLNSDNPCKDKPNSSTSSNLDLERENGSGSKSDLNPNREPSNGFDPFDSLITSGKRSKNGYSVNVFECPVCARSFVSEEEVSVHVNSCIDSNSVENSQDLVNKDCRIESQDELESCVGNFLSVNPWKGSIEVVLRLLRNVISEPENAKFRRIRLSNPKIREAIGEVAGGVELLEFVGFVLREEDGEMWAGMEAPTKEQIQLIKKVVLLLEPQNIKELPSVASNEVEEAVEPQKVDRQIQVFFSVPENVAAKIEVPDNFYRLSVSELKKEADTRKKKIAESQLLIPKSYKEKQAKTARKRYTKTVIRVQFPDGVVLQAFFSPREPTSALYEFVGSALKEASLEFDLIHPIPIKRRVIPRFPEAGAGPIRLEDEDLVPSALIKFRPVESDSVVFTGLSNELLQISEPLVAVVPL